MYVLYITHTSTGPILPLCRASSIAAPASAVVCVCVCIYIYIYVCSFISVADQQTVSSTDQART